MTEQVGYVGAIRAAIGDPAAIASVFEGRKRSWSETLDRAARTAAGLRALDIAPRRPRRRAVGQ